MNIFKRNQQQPDTSSMVLSGKQGNMQPGIANFATLKERLAGIFSYNRAIAECGLQEKTDFEQYEESLFLKDVKDAGVEFLFEESPDEIFLVAPPVLTAAPDLPPALKRWVDCRRNNDPSAPEPGLRSKIKIGRHVRYLKDLDDGQGLRQQYNQWLDVRRAWKSKEQSKFRQKELFDSMFNLVKRMEKHDSLELVLAIGLAQFCTETGESGLSCRRHLLTIPVCVSYDIATGHVCLRVAARAKIKLEDHFLPKRPEGALRRDLENALEDFSWSAEAMNDLQRLLTKWLHASGIVNQLDTSWSVPECRHENLTLSVSPALILRHNGQYGRRAFSEKALKKLSNLRAAEQLPAILRDVVQGTNAGVVNNEKAPDVTQDFYYFPLPHNDEHIRVARQIRTQSVSAVQGPPGTGKSQVAVNQLCHFLANGMRILVTAKNPQALEVLREKIPAVYRDLCVVFLGDDSASRDSLNATIEAIARRASSRGFEDLSRNIEDMDKRCRLLDQKERELFNTLLSSREKEQAAEDRESLFFQARELSTLYQEYAWLNDIVSDDCDLELLELPETMEEICQLDKGLVGFNEALISMTLPGPDDLPDTEEFARLSAHLTQLREDFTRYRWSMEDCRDVGPGCDSKQLELLIAETESVKALLKKLLASPQEWVTSACRDILTGTGSLWRVRGKRSRQILDELSFLAKDSEAPDDEALVALFSAAQDFELNLPEGMCLDQVRQAVLELENYRDNSLFKKVMNGKARHSKEALKDVTFNGRCVLEKAVLDELGRVFRVQEIIKHLDREFSSLLALPEDMVPKVMGFMQAVSLFESVQAFEQAVDDLKLCYKESNVNDLPPWNDQNELDSFLEFLGAVCCQKRIEEAETIFTEMKLYLEQKSVEGDEAHPVCAALCQAVQKENHEGYQQAADEMNDLWLARQQMIKKNELLDELKLSWPELASALSDNPEAWLERIDAFEDARTWLCQWRKLSADVNDTDVGSLMSQLAETREALRVVTAELGAAKGWWHTIERLQKDPELLQNLKAWQVAVSNLPATRTALSYGRKQKEAQSYLEQSYRAVPSWVMPIDLVYEWFDPFGHDGELPFDLIIMDEASQAEVTELGLATLSDRMLVMGDPWQTFPVQIGTSESDIVQLMDRHLPEDLPRRSLLALGNSFLQLFEPLFGAEVVHLREHYRCVPEIIGFSNELCYRRSHKSEVQTSLIPLRQRTSNLLDPIVTFHVPEGETVGAEGTKINRLEAERLVEAVERCCADPAYADKTFGVISLQSDAQSSQIWGMLMNRIPADELVRRQMLVGISRNFQGDERDVIFLSMVASRRNGEVINAQTTDDAIRRYNVAASRARDQVILVHSVDIGELRPHDLRFKMLEYYQRIGGKAAESAAESRKQCLNADWRESIPEQSEVASWRGLFNKHAGEGDKTPRELSMPFDSWFEVELFFVIVDQGYACIPQYPAFGADHVETVINDEGEREGFSPRLDLLVVGESARLAVEIDGEKWHGRNRYMHDLQRQEVLERCGWTVHRIRGCSYFIDPEGTLSVLWKRLDELNIVPPGISEDTAEGVIADLEKQELQSESSDASLEASEEEAPCVEFDETLDESEVAQVVPQCEDDVSSGSEAVEEASAEDNCQDRALEESVGQSGEQEDIHVPDEADVGCVGEEYDGGGKEKGQFLLAKKNESPSTESSAQVCSRCHCDLNEEVVVQRKPSLTTFTVCPVMQDYLKNAGMCPFQRQIAVGEDCRFCHQRH